MSQQSQQPHTSHFEAAKIIVETLQALEKTAQILAMRFAAETLGLQSPSGTQPPSAPVTAASANPPPGGGGTTHSTDIKQFTTAKSPKSDQQFAAVVAYFYRFEAPKAEQKDTIDATSLLEAARLAGRKRPSNPLDTLNNAKKAGYLDAVSSGKFQINSVGENLVAMTLPGNDSDTSRAARKKTVKKKTAKKAHRR